MSDRERLMDLVNHVPDYKIKYAIAYLQGLTVDEDEDDAFCEEMLQAYKDDLDPEKDVEIPLEECMKEWGIS